VEMVPSGDKSTSQMGRPDVAVDGIYADSSRMRLSMEPRQMVMEVLWWLEYR
jgi:hypothetical protein